jgi:hypothetical protein
MKPVENALNRAKRLLDQWERTAGPLPPDARRLLERLVWDIVLDAALCCDLRAAVEERNQSVKNEATKCGMSIRHMLLCRENENICLHCDGERCERCNQTGIKKMRSIPGLLANPLLPQ